MTAIQEKTTSFFDMNLPENLKASLTALGFTVPTPIQTQTIPLALTGKDVLGSAQTGTGKTLAFVIPLIAKICENPTAGGLILTPTRELAQQIITAIRAIVAKNLQIKTTLLIGGDPIFKQMQSLRSAPQIIVGTPGRVIDHLERGTLKTDPLTFLILDEADRMFDMGFGIQLDRIMSELPKERQTLMFSATLPSSIEKLASKHLVNPARVSIGSVISPIQNIKQDMVRVSEGDKYAKLLAELNEREGSAIIFVKTKMNTERLAEKLSRDGHEAIAIHGDLKQQKRERAINVFRRGTVRLMVATDVVARGLDIPHIQHVINYDLPQCPEDYIHRIGRTARAGAQGASLCLITPQDAKKWFAIQRFMDPSAKEEKVPYAGGGGGRRDSFSKAPARRGFSNSGRPGERSDRFSDSKPSTSRFSDDRRSDSPRSSEGNGERRSSPSRFSDDRRSDAPRSSEGNGERRAPARFSDDRRPSTPSRFSDDRRSDAPRSSDASGERRSSPSRFSDDRRSDAPRSADGNNDRRPSPSRFSDDRRSDAPRSADGNSDRRPASSRFGDERRPASPRFPSDGDRKPVAPRFPSDSNDTERKFSSPARTDRPFSKAPQRKDRNF